MKKLGIILLTSVAGVWLLVSLVRDVFDSIQYFSNEPRQLLYVFGFTIVGGLGALVFARLSRNAQRRVRLFGWGAAASALTLSIGYMVVRLLSLFSLVVESGALLGVLLVLLLLGAIAAYLWFEFSRVRKEQSSL
jgi:hypothetical protein